MRLASAAAASTRAASAASRAFAALEAARRARSRLRHHRLAAIWHATIALASRAATRRAVKPRNTLCTSIAARVRRARERNASRARPPRTRAWTLTTASRRRRNVALATRPRACF